MATRNRSGASFVLGILLVLGVLALTCLIQYGLIGRVFFIPVIIAGVLSALAVVITSRFMPRKTRKGRIAWEKIAGLQEYIRRAEVDSLQENERQGIFERLLPYAIIFGLSKRWGKAFADLYRQPPDWYQPARPMDFTTWMLINDIDRSMWMMNQTFPTQPRVQIDSGGGGGGGYGWSSGGFGAAAPAAAGSGRRGKLVVKNATWRSTWIVGFVLERRKNAMNASFQRSPDRIILHLVGALVCGLLISARAGAVDESVTPPRPHGPVPSARQLRWHELETYAFLHFSVNTFTDKEWGYGDESPTVFQPTAFDAEQIVTSLQAGGLKGAILTCKHHDGFCIWPSKYTEHSVKNSPWKGGKGDVVKEISAACRRHGLKFGVYLSPWDRNHKDYGRPKYITYYRNQLRELLTEYGPIFEVWFDGANGGDGYYGGDRTTRRIDPRTYYDWENTWKLVRELQPEACMFSDIGPTSAGWQ